MTEYLDLNTKEGKYFVKLGYEFLNDPICNFDDPDKNCDIIEIFINNGSYYLEMNYFFRGKYYYHSICIADNWIKQKLRDEKLNRLFND